MNAGLQARQQQPRHPADLDAGPVEQDPEEDRAGEEPERGTDAGPPAVRGQREQRDTDRGEEPQVVRRERDDQRDRGADREQHAAAAAQGTHSRCRCLAAAPSGAVGVLVRGAGSQHRHVPPSPCALRSTRIPVQLCGCIGSRRHIREGPNRPRTCRYLPQARSRAHGIGARPGCRPRPAVPGPGRPVRQGRAPVVFVPTRCVPVARPRPLSTDHATLPDTEERTDPPHPADPRPVPGRSNRTWLAGRPLSGEGARRTDTARRCRTQRRYAPTPDPCQAGRPHARYTRSPRDTWCPELRRQCQQMRGAGAGAQPAAARVDRRRGGRRGPGRRTVSTASAGARGTRPAAGEVAGDRGQHRPRRRRRGVPEHPAGRRSPATRRRRSRPPRRTPAAAGSPRAWRRTATVAASVARGRSRAGVGGPARVGGARGGGVRPASSGRACRSAPAASTTPVGRPAHTRGRPRRCGRARRCRRPPGRAPAGRQHRVDVGGGAADVDDEQAAAGPGVGEQFHAGEHGVGGGGADQRGEPAARGTGPCRR